MAISERAFQPFQRLLRFYLNSKTLAKFITSLNDSFKNNGRSKWLAKEKSESININIKLE